MLLSRLLQALPNTHSSDIDDVEIADLAYDSRQVRPGSLFVTVPAVRGGARSGGYAFIADALSRGAVAVVAQQGIDGVPVPVVLVSDARAALADLAVEFFNYPTRRLQLFAVTGTDGKTTTTFLLEQILRAAGYLTGLIGTVQTTIGTHILPNSARMTTPESLDLQRLFHTMLQAGVTHAVMEASSHALELQRLRGCRPAACALTNITTDHVEFHGGWERYYLAKQRLFTEIGADRPAVLNRDDASFERLRRVTTGAALSYSLEREADLYATDVVSELDRSGFTLHHGGAVARSQIPLPGLFNVSNALAAAGLALAAGLSLDIIAAGLAHSEAPPGRFYHVRAGQPFEVVVDYAHTKNAFASVLGTVRAGTPPPRRVIAVFGAAGNRDRDKRPVLARLARRYADFFIVTNEDPCDEPAEKIMAEIAAGVPAEEEGDRFIREPDRGRAIRRALALAQPGDAVVILGKGHEQSIVVQGRKEPWSDVAAVQDALGAQV